MLRPATKGYQSNQTTDHIKSLKRMPCCTCQYWKLCLPIHQQRNCVECVSEGIILPNASVSSYDLLWTIGPSLPCISDTHEAVETWMVGKDNLVRWVLHQPWWKLGKSLCHVLSWSGIEWRQPCTNIQAVLSLCHGVGMHHEGQTRTRGGVGVSQGKGHWDELKKVPTTGPWWGFEGFSCKEGRREGSYYISARQCF